MTFARESGGSEASFASRDLTSAARCLRYFGSERYPAGRAAAPSVPLGGRPAVVLARSPGPVIGRVVGRTLRPIHMPTASAAITAAAAIQRRRENCRAEELRRPA